MFASWGAGEHGYMGSMEWIEEFQTILTDRTVAHLNVDLAVIHTFNMLGELYMACNDLMYARMYKYDYISLVCTNFFDYKI